MWADLAPGRQQGAWDPSGSVIKILMYKKQVAMLRVVSVKGSRTLTVVAEVGTDKNVRIGVYFALWVLVMASIVGPNISHTFS